MLDFGYSPHSVLLNPQKYRPKIGYDTLYAYTSIQAPPEYYLYLHLRDYFQFNWTWKTPRDSVFTCGTVAGESNRTLYAQSWFWASCYSKTDWEENVGAQCHHFPMELEGINTVEFTI